MVITNRMAVAASDSTDTVAYFSDTGDCVEIIAPVSSSSTSCAHILMIAGI